MSKLLDFILQHEEAFSSRSRLSSLFADFSIQRTTNPDGYIANVSAWKKALIDAARAGVIPAPGDTHDLLNIRTGDELARALQHPAFGRPTCLPAIFHDAVSKKEFLPLKDFLESPISIYKKQWGPVAWSIVRWGLRQIGVRNITVSSQVSGGR
jgi:charged multivesicular body protein 7